MISVSPLFKISAKPFNTISLKPEEINECIALNYSQYIHSTPLDRLVLRFRNVRVAVGERASIVLYICGHGGVQIQKPLVLIHQFTERDFVVKDEISELFNSVDFDVIRIGVMASNTDIEVEIEAFALENEEIGQFLQL